MNNCGYDHAPVTRGRMRIQYPLPHGPSYPVAMAPFRATVTPRFAKLQPDLCILDVFSLVAKVIAVTTVFPDTGLPTFSLNPTKTTFHTANARTLPVFEKSAVFVLRTYASPVVGGLQGGHGNANANSGAVRRCAETPPSGNPTTRPDVLTKALFTRHNQWHHLSAWSVSDDLHPWTTRRVAGQ